MVLDSTWDLSLQTWGYVCAGKFGRLSINDNSSILWSGRDVPLCTQFLLIALLHLPLLFVSSFYAGGYQRRSKDKKTPKILQMIAVLSSLFVLVSAINFIYLFTSLTPEDFSLILLFVLIVKLLTWLVHTICIVQLVYSVRYHKDRPPTSCIVSWLLTLLVTLFHFISLITYKVHTDWYSSVDAIFLRGDSFLYTSSIELFLHKLYALFIFISYCKHRLIFLALKCRKTDPLSHSLLNIQHSYGSLRSYETENLTRPVNEEGVSWFSYLFFNWFNQTVKRGYKRKIETLDDLPSLPRDLRGSHLIAKFNKLYTNRQLNGKSSSKWRLLWSVVRVAGCKFYLAGVLKLTADAVTFTGPLLLNGLVYLVENNNQPIYIGYFYVLGLFVSAVTGMLLNVHFQYLVDKVNVSIQSALMNAVYQKVIRLNLAKLSTFSTGQVLDYMSTDASRLSGVWNVHLFWSMPVMISVCLYLLYLQVGLSFLAGLAFCVVIIAINQALTVLISRVFKKYMDCKDERIRLMSEILAGIRVIKLYAWERIFKNKISKVRANELKQLAWVKCLDGFCVFFWACTATMMCVLTFITYSLLGNELTAARVSHINFLLNFCMQ